MDMVVNFDDLIHRALEHAVLMDIIDTTQKLCRNEVNNAVRFDFDGVIEETVFTEIANLGV